MIVNPSNLITRMKNGRGIVVCTIRIEMQGNIKELRVGCAIYSELNKILVETVKTAVKQIV